MYSCFILALVAQLSHFNVKIPPNPDTSCAVFTMVGSAATTISTWLILGMTFERFYSIIRPHKAASFNTVKKARVIIVCIVVICAFFAVPHFFMTSRYGTSCMPFAKGTDHFAGKLYYWCDQVVGLGFPFISLLIMNSVIIHTLRKRSSLLLTRSDTYDEGQGQNQVQGQNQGHSSKMKSSEKQIIIMLLLVTFGFLVLMIPANGMTLYPVFVDFSNSPKLYAVYLLFISIGKKTFYTNYGINFYLYVISGSKFRSDLLKLFQNLCPYFCKEKAQSQETSSSTSSSKVNMEATSKGL